MSIYLDRMLRVARIVSLNDPGVGHDLEKNIRKIAVYSGGSGSYSSFGGPNRGKLRHIYFDYYKEAINKFIEYAKTELEYLTQVKKTFEINEKDGGWPKELAKEIGYDYKKGESLKTPNNPVGNSLLKEVLGIEQPVFGRTASLGKRLAFLRKKSRHHLALFKGIKEKIKGLFKGKEKPLEDIDLLEQGIFYQNGVPQTYSKSFETEIEKIFKKCQEYLSELSLEETKYKNSYNMLWRSPSYDKLMKCIEDASKLETEGKRALEKISGLEEKLVPKKTDAKRIEEIETEFFGSPLEKPSTLTITQKAVRLVDDPSSPEELKAAKELYYSLGEMLKRKNAL